MANGKWAICSQVNSHYFFDCSFADRKDLIQERVLWVLIKAHRNSPIAEIIEIVAKTRGFDEVGLLKSEHIFLSEDVHS